VVPAFRASAGVPLLLVAQSNAQDLGARLLCEMKRKTAPTAAYIQDTLARCKAKLCSNMAFFGELGLVEIFRAFLEVCAGILPVLVEKNLV